METKNIALSLYFASCLLTIIAIAFGSDTLRLFANPVVIPAIFLLFVYK